MKIQNSSSEKGASLVEYSLLIALIAIMGVASIGQVGTSSQVKFDYLSTAIATSGDGMNSVTYYNPYHPGCTPGAGKTC